MSEEGDKKDETEEGGLQLSPGPSVVLRRIDRIHTFEVLGSDLDHLDDVLSRENQALGFATASVGVAASTSVSWIAATTLSTAAVVIYATVTILSSLSTIWFGLVWRRVSKQRPKLLDRIRGRLTETTVTRTEQSKAVP